MKNIWLLNREIENDLKIVEALIQIENYLDDKINFDTLCNLIDNLHLTREQMDEHLIDDVERINRKLYGQST